MIMNDRRRTYSGQNLKEFICATGGAGVCMPNKGGNQWKRVYVKANNEGHTSLHPTQSLRSLKNYLLCNDIYLVHYSNFETAYKTDQEIIIDVPTFNIETRFDRFVTHNLYDINYDIIQHYDWHSDTYYFRKIKINVDGTYNILSETPINILNPIEEISYSYYSLEYNNYLYKDGQNLYMIMQGRSENWYKIIIIKSTTGDLDGFNGVNAYLVPFYFNNIYMRAAIRNDILYVPDNQRLHLFSLDFSTAIDYVLQSTGDVKYVYGVLCGGLEINKQ